MIYVVTICGHEQRTILDAPWQREAGSSQLPGLTVCMARKHLLIGHHAMQ